MATEVIIPQLGITVERGKITKWFKSEGESVNSGESIFEMESEKLVTEVESPATGVLQKIFLREGVEVPVLTVVGIITEKGEELPEKYRSYRVEAPSQPLPPSLLREPAPKARHAEAAEVAAADYDIAILGGGPGGYVAAIRAAQLGARVLLVEKDELGGTCLNWGCIPTKCLLSDINLYQKVKSSEVILHGEKLSLDLKKMILRKNHVVETLRKGVSVLLQRQGVTLAKGKGRFKGAKTIEVSLNGKMQTYSTERVIIATGSKPASLPAVKIDGRKIISSDDTLNLREIPRDVVIIGGGVVFAYSLLRRLWSPTGLSAILILVMTPFI